MKKAKKTKATALDRITARLRMALRRETTNVIEIGNLLIESRKHLQHGDWQAWLAETFDLSYRTALRYVSAAEYVAHKGKSDTVAHFTNLSPTILYGLAEGHFTEQEEAAILAAAREGRVDQVAADAICEKLAPPDDADDDQDNDDDHDDDGDDAEPAAAEDPEIAAILDGPPAAVPPPAPIPPPTDYALRDFDQAIGTLKRLMTKQAAQFAGSAHSGNDLENVASFIQAASDPEPGIEAITAERAEHTISSEPQTVAAAGTHSSRSRHANPRRIYIDFLKQMKPGDFRLELVYLCRAVASLDRGCMISISEESPEEVSSDSC
jgi:hypothetical protein